MSFWETTVNYYNARKVLVIPNITNYSNIEKDSFVDVLFNHVNALKSYGEYFWYVVMPKGNVCAKLNTLDNVKQIEVPIPGDMMNQRCFPPEELIGVLKNTDYDIIYSHLPDWNVVGRYKKTTDTKIIGYCHWWEMSYCNGVDNRPGKAKQLWLPNEILGVLQMDTCFINTQDQKNKVIEEAKQWFGDDVLKQLDEKLCVWNLGVMKDKILSEPNPNKHNIIVFKPMVFHNSDCYREIEPDGLFFNNQKELFELLDKILDDDTYRSERELAALKRANELSENDTKMFSVLHKKLSE